MAVIRGGPLLKIRLDNVADGAGSEIMAQWTEDAARLIRQAAPRRTGALAASIKPGVKGAASRGRFSRRAGVRGAVFGNFYGIILDRGAKAHSIQPKDGRPSTTGRGHPALKFEGKGGTIFRRSTFRRRMRRRPFITAGAQEALRISPWVDKVIQAWNRKAETRGFMKVRDG